MGLLKLVKYILNKHMSIYCIPTGLLIGLTTFNIHLIILK